MDNRRMDDQTVVLKTKLLLPTVGRGIQNYGIWKVIDLQAVSSPPTFFKTQKSKSEQTGISSPATNSRVLMAVHGCGTCATSARLYFYMIQHSRALIIIQTTTICWLRSTVGRTSVFGRRTDPVLRSACSRRVTTTWVYRPLQVSQLRQLSLSSSRGR